MRLNVGGGGIVPWLLCVGKCLLVRELVKAERYREVCLKGKGKQRNQMEEVNECLGKK